MSADDGLVAETVISLAAVCGLFVVVRRLRSSGPGTDLARIFATALGVVALFLSVRLVHWNTEFGIARFATYAIAALIPLMALLLAEELLRRHAPKWVKLYLSAGFIGLAFAALWPAATSGSVFAYALLGFQISAFLIIAALVVRRDHGSLTDAENRMVDRIGISLLVILPFMVTDYRGMMTLIPLRLSALAILVTCWLGISLARPKLRHRTYGSALALYLAAAGAAAFTLSWQYGLRREEAFQAGAIVLALILVATIVRDDLQLSEEATQHAVISEIGKVGMSSLSAYLDDLGRAGVLDGVLLLGGPELAEFDPADIALRFRSRSTVSLADLPPRPGNDTLSDSRLRALFERYAATHLVEVSQQPLRLAAIRQPGLSGREIDPDLSAAFGLARLVSERDSMRALLAAKGIE
jgi:hypothetical protein